MTRDPIVAGRQRDSARRSAPGREPVAVVVLLALVAQMSTTAVAQQAAGAENASAAADTAGPPTVGSTPAQVAPSPTREDRHWMELVRACTANAKHVRFHLPGRVVETDQVEPEASGVRFRAPHLPARSGAITSPLAGTDTLVAWSDISKVEVRNVASTGERAATGAVVGLVIGLPFAIAVAVAAAMASIFTFRQQDSPAGGILLGAAAVGLAVGAATSHHANGGWVTCCERDTSRVTHDSGTLH